MGARVTTSMSDLGGSLISMQMIDYKGNSPRRGRNASNRYFAQVLCDQAAQRRAELEAARRQRELAEEMRRAQIKAETKKRLRKHVKKI